MSHLEELDESKDQEQSHLGDKQLGAEGEEGDIGPMPLARMEVRGQTQRRASMQWRRRLVS